MGDGNGRYEIKESFYHLELSCRLIAEKIQKHDTSKWTNGDYIRLSGLLLRSTSVQISANTLKRIFGKLKTPERYYPQKATRDALVQFLGYLNWDVFVQQHARVHLSTPVESGAPVDSIPDDPEQSALSVNRVQIMHQPVQMILPDDNDKLSKHHSHQLKLKEKSLLSVAVIAFFAFGFYLFSGMNSEILPAGVKLECKNPEGSNPHSAVFALKLPENFDGNPEDFTISFGDGKAEKKLYRGVVFTHYYEIPGRYYAELKYKGASIDTIPIYLKTKGWTATARVEKDSMRVYPVQKDSLFAGQILSVSAAALKHAGVDTNRTFFVDFVNAAPSGINGDNFQLTCFVNTSEERPGVRCSQLEVMAFGDKAYHKLVMLKPGCEAWTYLRFSDLTRDASDNDLEFLGADLTRGGKLMLTVKNKMVTVSMNDRKVYTAAYTKSLGTIYGIKLSFSGIGQIHDVSLKDINTGSDFAMGMLK